MFAALVFVAFLIGCMLPWQPVINARLGSALTSAMLAGFISFIGGAFILGFLALVRNDFIGKSHLFQQAPWWSYFGGVLGAIFVVVSLILVPKIGTTALGISFICGQLLMAIIMDHYGLAGLAVRPVDGQRLLGVALVLLGAFLVTRPHGS